MRYLLFIFFIAFCHTEIKGQDALFLQRLAEEVQIDSIISIAHNDKRGVAILSLDAFGNQSLQIINGRKKSSFSIDKHFSSTANIALTESDSILLQDGPSMYYFKFDDHTWKKIKDSDFDRGQKVDSAIWEKKMLISIDGIVAVEKRHFNPLTGAYYWYANGNIYHRNRAINEYLEYYIVDSGEESDFCRFARPLGDGQWIVGLNEAKKVYLKNGEQEVNIFDFPENENATDMRLYHVAYAYGSLYFTGEDYHIYKMDLERYKLVSITPNRRYQYKNIVTDSRGNLFAGSIEGATFKISPNDKITKLSIDNEVEVSNNFRFYDDEKGWHWWGYRQGLSVVLPDGKTHIGFNEKNGLPLGLKEISGISVFKGRLYLSTYSYGMYSFDEEMVKNALLEKAKNPKMQILWESLDMKKMEVNTTERLTEVRHIIAQNDKLLIRKSDILYIYDGKKFSKISQNEGWYGGIINFFSSTYGDAVVYSTVNGFFLFYPQRYDSLTTASNLFITEINVGKETLKADHRNMTYDIGTLDEYFPYISLGLAHKSDNSFDLGVQYVVDKKDTVVTENSFFVLPNNGVGKHNVTISSVFDPSGAKPLELVYTVGRRWYNTWWARLLGLCLLGGLTYYLSHLWMRKNKLEKNMRLLETESLRSYMNPHFISNSLNSINYYILRNEKEVASRYIIKFSKLVRRVLQNSEKEFITIGEELNTLRNYIEIEQMRFPGKFEYKIHTNEHVNEEDEIPSFILQPIVENAIWHGLIQKGSDGNLEVFVIKKAHTEEYNIRISDDGVGYEASLAIQSKSATKRKSYGFQIIKKRLQLLNQIYGYKNSIEIKDRKYTDETKGTTAFVTLNIHKPQ